MDHFASDQIAPADEPLSAGARRRNRQAAVTFAKLPPIDVPLLSTNQSVEIADSWTKTNSSFASKVGLTSFGPCLCLDPPDDEEHGEQTKRQKAHNCCSRHGCAELCIWLGNALKVIVFSLLPVLSWAPKIRWSSLRHDLLAGLTVGVMLIPQ
jgi:hypothetical protein